MSCDHGKGDWGPRNKRHRKPKRQSRMDNPEKLAILGTQYTKRRQTKQKNTTLHVLDTTMRKQTQN